MKWRETEASSPTIVFQKNARERDQLKDESLAVHFNLLICLSWVASRPCQQGEAVEPVEYLLGFVLWKVTQYSAVPCLYQNAFWRAHWPDTSAVRPTFECIAPWGLQRGWQIQIWESKRRWKKLLIACMYGMGQKGFLPDSESWIIESIQETDSSNKGTCKLKHTCMWHHRKEKWVPNYPVRFKRFQKVCLGIGLASSFFSYGTGQFPWLRSILGRGLICVSQLCYFLGVKKKKGLFWVTVLEVLDHGKLFHCIWACGKI